jgi:hypothetical protein
MKITDNRDKVFVHTPDIGDAIVLRNGSAKLIVCERGGFWGLDVGSMYMSTRKYRSIAEVVDLYHDDTVEIIPANQLELVIKRSDSHEKSEN